MDYIRAEYKQSRVGFLNVGYKDPNNLGDRIRMRTISKETDSDNLGEWKQIPDSDHLEDQIGIRTISDTGYGSRQSRRPDTDPDNLGHRIRIQTI